MPRLRKLKERASSLLENAVERVQNAIPDVVIPPIINPNNYSFTADLNWISPWDCHHNPNSALCGGRPWSVPLDFRFDFDQDECNTSWSKSNLKSKGTDHGL
ncbi:MAG: hypothetical protein F6K23_39920, partial [Okeania sp. SIO2C9]|uniref:hypothetical protein n=1 Tax=Okeania sp. SIO2C9 TaxID=2607791 RepID=UPI0013C17655